MVSTLQETKAPHTDTAEIGVLIPHDNPEQQRSWPSICSVRRDQIVESPEAQPRDKSHVIANLNDLANSLLSRGMLDPIKVTTSPEDDKYHVLDGHRRLAALDMIGITDPRVLQHINVLVMRASRPMEFSTEFNEAAAKLDATDQSLVDAAALNSLQSGLSAAEQGRVYIQLRAKLGRTELVAKAAGVTPQYVNKAIRAAGAVRAVQKTRASQGEKADYRPLVSPRKVSMMGAIIRDAKAMTEDQRSAVVKWLRACTQAVERHADQVPLP